MWQGNLSWKNISNGYKENTTSKRQAESTNGKWTNLSLTYFFINQTLHD